MGLLRLGESHQSGRKKKFDSHLSKMGFTGSIVSGFFKENIHIELFPEDVIRANNLFPSGLMLRSASPGNCLRVILVNPVPSTLME